jgi:ABC-type enterobactin transport system permease subunit
MAVYHRKPITVDAVQWLGTNEEEMIELLASTTYMSYRNQVTNMLVFDVWSGGSVQRINYKDVVIKDSKNELLITSEKSFSQNYELVED